MTGSAHTSLTGAVTADAYLAVVGAKQGPIKGESDTPGRINDITVLAWRWGVKSAHATGSTLATGRRNYDVLQIDKQIDSSTTALLSALATNETIKSATLSLSKAGADGATFFRIKLELARIVSSQLQSTPAGGIYETIEIAYLKIEMEYNKQGASGRLGGGMVFNDEMQVSN